MLQQFPGAAQAMSLSTLALTTLLHGIGTTHDHLRAMRLSFEFQQLGAPQEQAEVMAEAIIRHQDLGTTGSITFLGQLIQLTTVCDNMGGDPGLMRPHWRTWRGRARATAGVGFLL